MTQTNPAATAGGAPQPPIRVDLLAQSNNPTNGGKASDIGQHDVQGYGPDGKTVFKAQVRQRIYNDGSAKTRFYVNGKALPVGIQTLETAKVFVRQQMRKGALGTLPLGNQRVFAKPNAGNKPTTAAASGKPVRLDAAAIYSLTGAVASYNINRQTGMSRQQALALVPAGIARDLITVGLSQFPIDVKEPKLEVLTKGGIGGLLTVATNAVAGKINANAWPGHTLNGGMVLAAFTVNGNLVGLRELQSRGYLGGKPADTPKDWGQWFHKYGLEGAAISTGVSTAITPAVAINEILKSKAAGGQAIKWGTVTKTGAATLVLPLVQYLIANAFVNAPKDGKAAKPDPIRTQLEQIAGNIANVGTMVGIDKLASLMKTAPPAGSVNPKFSLGKSTGSAALLLGIGHIVEVFANQESLRTQNIKTVEGARQALATIDQLTADWYSQAKSAIYGDGYMTYLNQMRGIIYEMHPSLKPKAQ
jgi:hypothetical protein